ncbi:MAG: SDR family NAD(P)-dependent oxidoreductase [Alphaproteobacteria bacterium]|jgi:NAD(P)-dependent dehydrogenase (short-subunit alcohol dehydrogenase family)|nr:SDR family NAD(P)-dependent oxidoreductase [Alphaproteobacteria bacterium]MDP6515648.1 SDR family NAD(P)-dependent oxidoreductase [Alphaproteobacteria bacterium]
MAGTGRHCLVIGVGVGTGLACVRRFAAGGYRVSMIARNGERLAQFATEVEGAAAYPTDIAKLDGYRATLRRIVAAEGEPAIVIYNAALATFTDYTGLDPADFERNFRVNTTGLLVTAQELAPAMAARGEGAIVVTGNTGALRGVPSFVGFSPTKASQRILAECLARDLGPKGVHVAYVVVDALIDMPFARRRFTDRPDDAFAKPDELADEIFHVAHQPRSARSFLVELRPFGETW